MFGRFGVEGAYLTAADAVARSGAGSYEVQALIGGIRSSPKSAQLWTALGDALVRHDGGRLSAPARFAFDHAIRLDPRHPGPRFFLGLAQVRAEDFEGAEVSCRQALARTASTAGYRPAIAQRLELLRTLNRR
jgi:cytochrome c-type biogenesis protein CcmH/NrfG